MSFDLTDYEARRRADPERKEYLKEYFKNSESYKEYKKEYYRSSKYKKWDKERNQSFDRKQYQKEWHKKQKLKVSGNTTLEDFLN